MLPSNLFELETLVPFEKREIPKIKDCLKIDVVNLQK